MFQDSDRENEKRGKGKRGTRPAAFSLWRERSVLKKKTKGARAKLDVFSLLGEGKGKKKRGKGGEDVSPSFARPIDPFKRDGGSPTKGGRKG